MGYLARDIMETDVIAVRSDMDIKDLSKLFLERGITGAPVVNENGQLVGVISQTDLVYYHLTRGDQLVLESDFYQRARMEGQHVPVGFQVEDFNTARVAEVMTPVVHTVGERAGLQSIARTMSRHHIHRVVVRRGRRIVGIISALDVLRIVGSVKKKTSSKRAPSRKKAPARKARTRASDAKAPARKARTRASDAKAPTRKARSRGRR